VRSGLAITHFIKPDRMPSVKKLALLGEGEKEKHMNERVILEIFSDYV
jgi:hypothetical protein